MKSDEIASCYKKTWDRDSYRIPHNDFQMQLLQRNVPETRDARILDAGCGNGKYAMALAQQGYSNIRAADLFDSIPTNGLLHYYRADISQLDEQDDSVDFLYSLSVLYYMDRPQDALKEFFRVMKPGARVVFTCHTKYSLYTLERRVLRKFGRMQHLRDVRFRSAGAYQRWLVSAGFNVLDVDGFDMLYAPAPLIPLKRALLKTLNNISPDEHLSGAALGSLKAFRATCGYHFSILAEKPDTTGLPRGCTP